MSATILLVDDDSEIRELLELLLTGEGYAVLQAESGEAAPETKPAAETENAADDTKAE